MILTALAIVTNLDVNFDQFVAQHIPDVNLTASLECSSTVTEPPARDHRPSAEVRPGERILGLRRLGNGGASGRRATPARRPCSPTRTAADARGGARIHRNRRTGSTRPATGRCTLASLRGRVVLVDFWTYTCINCIRTLPYLKAWDAAYRNAGLTIVGVETPEFAFEHDAGNVANAIGQFGLRYPVVQDNNMGTWNAYGNQYWPADYLIDAHGQVRYTAFGEGDYAQDRNRDPRAARRSRPPGRRQEPPDRRDRALANRPRPRPTSAPRARRAGSTGPKAGLHDYGPPPTGELAAQRLRLQRHLEHRRTARHGRLRRRDRRRVPGQERLPRAELARRTAAAGAGAARRPADLAPRTPAPTCTRGVVTVRGQRLYTLVSLPRSESHRLSLRFAPGVSGYAFTFG